MRLWTTLDDLDDCADELRRWSHGVIETAGGELVGVHLRAWPSIVSIPEVWFGEWRHRSVAGDRCWIYWNTPIGFPNYLAVSYCVSYRDTTLATIRRGLTILDRVAELRETDALLCEASNLRISERLLRRWGWERHCLDDARRHYIKRFYGVYPPGEASWEEQGTAGQLPCQLPVASLQLPV